MINFNWSILFIAAIVPLITGFIWYHPQVMGTAWMKASGVNVEEGKKMNMPLTFGLTYVLGVLMAATLMVMVIHQMHFYSILADTPGINDPNSEVGLMAKNFMDQYGRNYRTFKHGVFHGTLDGIFLAMPIIAIN